MKENHILSLSLCWSAGHDDPNGNTFLLSTLGMGGPAERALMNSASFLKVTHDKGALCSAYQSTVWAVHRDPTGAMDSKFVLSFGSKRCIIQRISNLISDSLLLANNRTCGIRNTSFYVCGQHCPVCKTPISLPGSMAVMWHLETHQSLRLLCTAV